MANSNEKNEFISDDDMNIHNMETNDIANETLADGDNMSDSCGEVNWEEKYNELNNSYLRLHAEFDNYRKRTLKEKTDLIKSAGEKVIVELLPILDDFERALENIPETEGNELLKEGVYLIYNKFVDFLLKNGVKRMDVIGQTFDMDKHEALTTIPTDDDSQRGKIVDCVQQGYEMGDKVIRFPKVIVAK